MSFKKLAVNCYSLVCGETASAFICVFCSIIATVEGGNACYLMSSITATVKTQMTHVTLVKSVLQYNSNCRRR